MPQKKSSQPHYFELFRSANAFILDVDGVLTDGSLLVTNSGDELRRMNIRDGYALQLAVKRGYKVVIITGGRSNGVVRRLNRLGVEYVLTGIDDKPAALKQLVKKLGVDLKRTIYIGDDLPDLEVMQKCGIPCCPNDAVTEVRAIAKYISPAAGGMGCVRDILEKVMKLQEKW